MPRECSRNPKYMKDSYINVFISHSWAYSEHYETLVEWIFEETWTVNNGQQRLYFFDLSVPKDDPIHNAPNQEALRAAIYEKIGESNIVVIPSGMYATHSDWIEKEIAGSKWNGKPILAVNPFGQERKAGIVLDNATDAVGWNKKSVVGSVWKLYRQ